MTLSYILLSSVCADAFAGCRPDRPVCRVACSIQIILGMNCYHQNKNAVLFAMNGAGDGIEKLHGAQTIKSIEL